MAFQASGSDNNPLAARKLSIRMHCDAWGGAAAMPDSAITRITDVHAQIYILITSATYITRQNPSSPFSPNILSTCFGWRLFAGVVLLQLRKHASEINPYAPWFWQMGLSSCPRARLSSQVT